MNLQTQISQNMVNLHSLGKVQVVVCYNMNARRFPLFLDRISDMKSAGFCFGASDESKVGNGVGNLLYKVCDK